ncbi:uncharacterized protein LOC124268589 [Haliotis rubra]|uniref:uncharacterized protein LOC124268589 n=1 Tax=Haliotis rubra TaxID=36100 RepID=UPI001EE60E5C|nr:uncharacterized protein LOC124268589 [Haliotis rubra]
MLDGGNVSLVTTSHRLKVKMFVSKTTQFNTPFIYVLLSLVAVWPYCAGELLCPKITELDSPVKLTCIQAFHTGAHSYSTPIGTTAASCDLAENKCITLDDFTATVLNKSSSILAIPRLLPTHAGSWTCVVDADSPSPDTCYLTVEKSPACRIMSKQSTRTVRVGEELSLTIILRGYYCSEAAHVQVKTGTPRISTTETDVTNTSTTEKGSTEEDYLTLISVVIFPIAITVFIATVVVLVWRRWHNHATQPTKVDIHYVHEADPAVSSGSQERDADTTWYKDAPLASEEDTSSETL